MKIIQTLYMNDSDYFTNNYGWLSPIYNMMSWTLSALQLNRYYDNVELYVNHNAAFFLVDLLELPYKNVILSHNNLDIIDARLWALPKIYTYSLQKDPFLHIDGDVFIFSPFFNDNIRNSSLVAQNYEVGSGFYGVAQKDLMENLEYFPDCVKKDFFENYPVQGVNAGVLGGNDIDFLQEYSFYALQYIEKNKSKLDALTYTDRFNVFFEQHLFYALAKETNTPITMLFPGFVTDNQYRNMGEFDDVPHEKQYLHLLGHYKRDERTCLQMAETLKKLYPEHFYKIVSICNDHGIKHNMINFYKKYFTSYIEFTQLNEECKSVFYKNDEKVKKNIAQGEENFEDAKCFQVLDNYLLNTETASNEIDLDELKNDYVNFKKKVNEKLVNMDISEKYLYGRDLMATKWSREIFENKQKIKTKKLQRQEECFIIKSKYDWAAILKAEQGFGAEYYDDFKVKPGTYCCLISPEIGINKFWLNDIDEFEYLIFTFLKKPATIEEVLFFMKQYVEEDVLSNYYDVFEELIFILLKNLIKYKAISPANQN